MQNARVLFKTQRSFSVPTTKDPNNASGIEERQVLLIFIGYFIFNSSFLNKSYKFTFSTRTIFILICT